jgi:hypothetical protein
MMTPHKLIFPTALLSVVCCQAQGQSLPVLITWDYSVPSKMLLVHATNNSGKDIVAYTISIRHRLPDGTLDKQSWSGTSMDMLVALIRIQMAKDPAAERRMHEQGNGLFSAGTTRGITMHGFEASGGFDAVAGVVFYADGSFEKEDDNAFKRMLADRRSQLPEMQKADQIMRAALADETDEQPGGSSDNRADQSSR